MDGEMQAGPMVQTIFVLEKSFIVSVCHGKNGYGSYIF
jgi:hypothetical protein